MQLSSRKANHLWLLPRGGRVVSTYVFSYIRGILDFFHMCISGWWMHRTADVHVSVCVYVKTAGCLGSSSIFCLTAPRQGLSEPETHGFGWTGWAAGFWDPLLPIAASPHCCGYRHAHPWQLLHGCWDSSSGPHACRASVCTHMSISPTPWTFSWLYSCLLCRYPACLLTALHKSKGCVSWVIYPADNWLLKASWFSKKNLYIVAFFTICVL